MPTEYLDSNGLETLWGQIRAADAAVLTSANNDRTIIETYNLPSLTASSSTNYNILTSKSAVTIEQGGTGATSASAARTNLGLGTMATEAASSYLAKSTGGTLNGNIRVKYTAKDFSTAPSSVWTSDAFGIQDNNDMLGAIYRIGQNTSNDLYVEIGARREISNTTYFNIINYTIKSDGTKTVSVSDAAAWRTALGLGSMATQASSSYLPLTGGTLTGSVTTSGSVTSTAGAFYIKSDTSPNWGYRFYTANGNNRATVALSANNNFYFIQQNKDITADTNNTGREDFVLPSPTSTTAGTKSYDILTTKNAVTVAQGGTGATTASEARTKLGITPANIGAATSTHSHTLALYTAEKTGLSTTSGTITKVTSINLAAGDHLVIATCSFAANATGVRWFNLSSTSASSTSIDKWSWCRVSAASTGDTCAGVVVTRIRAASATTVYLNALQNSGSTLNVTGGIQDIQISM